MEPNQSTPEQIPNRAPAQPEQGGHERALSHLTEISVGVQVEKEAPLAPSTGDTATSAQAATAAVLPVPTVAQDDNTATTDDAATPLIAADEDLIEKEWVDKAKKIILETKDDPYRREQEVKKIQIDYVKKRYGRDIGASSE